MLPFITMTYPETAISPISPPTMPLTALLAGLPKYFAHTDFYHWQAFEPEFLNENKPDVLVYEVVERDLGRMMEDLEKLMPNQ